MWILNLKLPNRYLEDGHKVTFFGCLAMDSTWKLRNKILHEGAKVDPMGLLNIIYGKFSKHFSTLPQNRDLSPDCSVTHEPEARWSPPPEGYIKLNVDAAFRDGNSATGIVCSSNFSMVLCLATEVCSSTSVLMAEFLALSHGSKYIHLESDSQVAIRSLLAWSPPLD